MNRNLTYNSSPAAVAQAGDADGVPKKQTCGGRQGVVGWTGTNNPAGEPPDSNLVVAPAKPKRKSPAKPWKKEKGFPKRPLSAYNFFFRDERQRLLEASTSRKLGFAQLAKTVASRWKTLDDVALAPYKKAAAEEKNLYNAAVRVWRIQKRQQTAAEQVEPQAPPKAEATASKQKKKKAKGEKDDDGKQRWEQAKIASFSVPAASAAQSGVDSPHSDAADWLPSSLWEDDDDFTATPSTKHGTYGYETQQRHLNETGNSKSEYTGTPSSTTAATWPTVTPAQRGEDYIYNTNEWSGGVVGERRRSETPETTMNSAGLYNSYPHHSTGLFPKPSPPVLTYYQTGFAPAYRGPYYGYDQDHYDAEYYTPPPPLPPILHQPCYFTFRDNNNNSNNMNNNNHPVASWSPPHDTTNGQYFVPYYASDVVLAPSAGPTMVGTTTTRTDDPAAVFLGSGNRTYAAVASSESSPSLFLLPSRPGSPSSPVVGVAPTNLFGHLKEEEEADDDDEDNDSSLVPYVGLENTPSTDEEFDP
jgi:HMG (high mobility group) box